MKIVLDVNFPFGHAAGLEIWVEGLIDGLACVDTENQYLIFGFFMRNFEERIKKIRIPRQENFQLFVRRVPRPLIAFFENNNISIIERWLSGEKVDVFHGTGYFLPRLKKIKGIVTIHGLDFVEMDVYWYSDKWYKNVHNYLKRASIIIAVSEHVKNAIVQHYGIERERIMVVYPGVRKEFMPLENTGNSEIFERFKISFPYLLTVATSVERKNLKRLLDAFAILAGKNRDLKLFIAGDRSIQDKIVQQIQQHKLENRVVFTGYLGAEQLACLYNMAEAFVFPSLYEGFGLPVLEAMACGCPVITSNVSALPEVAGNAAILVNPYSIEQLVEAMEKVLQSSYTRERMRMDGLKRAKDFSWEKSARQMIEVYHMVMNAD
ncbi:MAG: glycosyltransferase family 4 protein [Candidatus Omnitrophica bacterium]|nr:glycosyltransferase family 4 protein [Candidatus Omnitrophota bacterium]MCM8828357.1 glycosyltransferase family 4 protein [Candidatus Omnitrophota bacterium]